MGIVSGGGGGAATLPTTLGSGTPIGSVTPSKRGAVYQDTATGAIFVAYGLTNADWMQFAGPQEVSSGPVILAGGLATNLHDLNGALRGIAILSPSAASSLITISDVNASNGSGNGLYWNPQFATLADGAQELHAYTGPTGDFRTELATAAGHVMAGQAVGGKAVSAPADAALAAGQFLLWLDATNGAAKLMVKAKQANGTVVAASVALA